ERSLLAYSLSGFLTFYRVGAQAVLSLTDYCFTRPGLQLNRNVSPMSRRAMRSWAMQPCNRSMGSTVPSSPRRKVLKWMGKIFSARASFNIETDSSGVQWFFLKGLYEPIGMMAKSKGPLLRIASNLSVIEVSPPN